MKRTGVWSFRTRTGVARVVNGRLCVRHTPRGLIGGVWTAGWRSWLQLLAFAFGLVGVVRPLSQLWWSTLSEQSLIAALSAASVGSLLLTVSMLTVITTSLWSTLKQPATIPVYDISRVTIDETELTVTYEADDGEHETTVEARDDESLEEAVEVLQLKGASVKRN